MPVYTNSEQLYDCLKDLFHRVGDNDPSSTQTVLQSKLILRMRFWSPAGEVTINGRHNPLQITYGPSPLRSDLEVELSADAFHQILLKELGFKKALAAGQLKVRGPVWKSFVMEGIFRSGQALYPQVLHDHGLDGAVK